MGLNLSDLSPARILRGTVISSNSETYRVEVAFDNRGSASSDVQVASLYCHPYSGEGIDVLPAPDASVYVFIPSDGSLPFILGYVMPNTKTGRADMGGRRPRKHGEYIFHGRDGNFLALRSGGVLEIGASPLAQSLYLPLGNLIREIFAQKECLSILGQMRWTHADVGTDLTTKASFVFEHKDAVEDLFPRLTVEVSSDKSDFMPEGYVSTSPSAAFTVPKLSFLRLKVDGGQGLSGLNILSEFAFQVSLEGDLYIHSEGYTLIDSVGPLRLESKDSLELIGPLSSDVTTALGFRTVRAVTLDIETLTNTFRSTVNSFEGFNQLGGASAVHPIPRGDVLIAWVTAVSGVLGIAPPVGLLSTNNTVS